MSRSIGSTHIIAALLALFVHSGAASAITGFSFAQGDPATTNQQAAPNTDFPLPVRVQLMSEGQRPGPVGPTTVAGTLSIVMPTTGASATPTPRGPFADNTRDDQGRYPPVRFRANGVPGIYVARFQMTTQFGPVSTDVVLKNLNGALGPAVSLAAVTGGGQSASVNRGFATPLKVVAVDARNNTVPGLSVVFSAPLAPDAPSLSFLEARPAPIAKVLTAFDGTATIPAFAGWRHGSYSVLASANGLASAPSFPMSNVGTAGEASRIVAADGDGQRAELFIAFSEPLEVRIQDGFGAGVGAQQVTFAAPAGPGPGASLGSGGATLVATTDGAGIARATATANGFSGMYQIVATRTGLPSVVFGLENVLPGTDRLFGDGFE